jgi:sugar/nucleoside kinase (ribokinase family)
VVSAGERGAWACEAETGELYHRPIVPGSTVDRIGRGDALCAGFLFGHAEGGPEFGLACGTALASLAQTFEGDLAWITREDVLALTGEEDAGRFR